MEHLSLEVFDLEGTGSKFATLPEDASITITDTSEIFASGDVWSHEFSINVYENEHIFGTAGEIHGSRLHEQIHMRRARLWVEGIPLYLGYLTLENEVDVESNGNISVRFESGQKTFESMIDGAKANQVPLPEDVQIGIALWRKRWACYSFNLLPSARFANATYINNVRVDFDGEDDESSIQSYPRMVFPKGKFLNAVTGREETVNFINTDLPYTEDEDGTPTNPYCNVALCYQKYGYTKKKEDGSTYQDYSGEPEAEREYEYMPANRVNSAPNFFVIYWIRALMKHLGIYIEENDMMGVEDLRRLFFVNTNCDYDEPKQLRKNYNPRYGKYTFVNGERLVPEYVNWKKNTTATESSFQPKEWKVVSGYREGIEIKDLSVKLAGLHRWSDEDINEYKRNNSYLHKAYATSECFPNVEISDVIAAIESGFGVRLLFSSDYRRVRIVLLRNLFKSKNIQEIACEIISESKQENSKRGFRMTYGNTEDTHFYYKGFADKLPHQKELWPDNSDTHDYSYWNLDAKYESIIYKVSAFDKTCYVTKNTGNAFGIKVDKDAKKYNDLHPSLFEFAGFMDAEDGDCTGDEETIETVEVKFTPIIMNDLNMKNERGDDGTPPVSEQRFALFVDEKMSPRRPDFKDGTDYNDPDVFYKVDEAGGMYEKFGPGSRNNQSADGIVKPGDFAVGSDAYIALKDLKFYLYLGGFLDQWALVEMSIEGSFSEWYHIYLQDNYEPNDEGISPIEKHDWGLTLGIMRGSGSDASITYSADPEDGEGNDTWDVSPGSNATSHPDTCDCYGNEWEYRNSTKVSPSEAEEQLAHLFPGSDAPFYDPEKGYITGTMWIYLRDNAGRHRTVLLASEYSVAGRTITGSGDIRYFVNLTLEELQELSRTSRHVIVETDTSDFRGETLVMLCHIAYGGGDGTMTIDNGVASRFGRFSLKLRAEKPNPNFDASRPESSTNRRYLQITNENLQRRGLCDQFYREYSYWIRNARIVKRVVKMELAQFLAIDKNVRATFGDTTGFIRKMQFTVSNKTGMGTVEVELMYI